MNRRSALAAVILALPVWHGISTWYDFRGLHSRGRLVRTANANLHIYCRGGASPQVVFLGGLGSSYLEFHAMQARLLAGGVPACTYDRAGGGWSEASTQVPTVQNAAAELLATLAEIGGAARPVVLVAHSYGAMVAQAAAVLALDRIGALVLLDPSYPEEIAVEGPPPERLALLMPLLAPAGLLRLRSLFAFDEQDPAFPAEVRAEAAALAKQTRHMLAFGREIRSVRAGAAWLTSHPLAFGAKPLMVIGRDKGGAALAERHRYQRMLAEKSTQGRFEIAAGSDHFIHAGAPDLVYQHILAVAARVPQAQELSK